jgi:DNA-binding PucR family transcriptional regulator
VGDTIKGLDFLGVPMTIAGVIVGVLLILQIIGKILECYGKIAPGFMRIFQRFSQKRKEKQEKVQVLQEVKRLLSDVNEHYSADNIAKRDSWMNWVNSRAVVYDNTIVEVTNKLADITQALKDNTKMTEDMFVENSRDRIIDFAEKAADYNIMLSREQFRRVDRVYQEYEKFLKDRGRQNGEVDIAYEAIQDGYKYRLQHHSFLEDVKGYKIK